MMHVLFSEG